MSRNEWWSAKDLVGFDGLPNSRQQITRIAAQEEWASRAKKGRGGGSEYHISSLPKLTQRAISISESLKARSAENQKIKELIANDEFVSLDLNDRERRQDVLSGDFKLQSMSDKAKARAEAKSIILTEIKVVQAGASRSDGISRFIPMYNNGQVAVPAWVRELYPTVKRSTLHGWFNQASSRGGAGLAGDYGKRKGSGIVDSQPDMELFIKGVLFKYPEASITNLHLAVQAHFVGSGLVIPSKRSLQSWVKRFKAENKREWIMATDPDAYNDRYRSALGDASEAVSRLNELWELDSTPSDLMLKDGRHNLVGVLDVYSRRSSVVVAPTSNAKGVAKAIKKAILAWGVPERAKTDNGSDYKSEHIRGAFIRLGVEQEFCAPYSGWEKPFVERFFRTYQHNLVEIMTGFVGHNVSQRQRIEAQKAFSKRLELKDEVIEINLTSSELQEFIDEWLKYYYHQNVHSSLKKSPDDMARDWPGRIKTLSEDELDLLLAKPLDQRVVSKSNHISLNGGRYISPELGGHIGELVTVYENENDFGSVYIVDAEGELICEAVDPETTGVSVKEVAAQSSLSEKEMAKEVRAQVAAAKKRVRKVDHAKEVLNLKKQEYIEKNTVPFPKSSEAYTGGEAGSVRQFLEQNTPRSSKPASDVEESSKLSSIHQLKPAFSVPRSWKERLALYESLKTKVDNGAAIDDPAVATWFQDYQFDDLRFDREMEQMGRELLERRGKR